MAGTGTAPSKVKTEESRISRPAVPPAMLAKLTNLREVHQRVLQIESHYGLADEIGIDVSRTRINGNPMLWSVRAYLFSGRSELATAVSPQYETAINQLFENLVYALSQMKGLKTKAA